MNLAVCICLFTKTYSHLQRVSKNISLFRSSSSVIALHQYDYWCLTAIRSWIYTCKDRMRYPKKERKQEGTLNSDLSYISMHTDKAATPSITQVQATGRNREWDDIGETASFTAFTAPRHNISIMTNIRYSTMNRLCLKVPTPSCIKLSFILFISWHCQYYIHFLPLSTGPGLFLFKCKKSKKLISILHRQICQLATAASLSGRVRFHFDHLVCQLFLSLSLGT